MAIALARDKLHYSDEQLVALSSQINRGDLTPILEIYEEDIKSPVKSAVSGTLLRNLFIQIQKAKVRFLLTGDLDTMPWFLCEAVSGYAYAWLRARINGYG